MTDPREVAQQNADVVIAHAQELSTVEELQDLKNAEKMENAGGEGRKTVIEAIDARIDEVQASEPDGGEPEAVEPETDDVSEDEGLGVPREQDSHSNVVVGNLGAPEHQEMLADYGAESAQRREESLSISDEELSEEEPFYEGGLRRQSLEHAADGSVIDPSVPAMNTEYVKERAEDILSGEGPNVYAMTQEGQISSNSDDLAQRESLALAAGEALRRETELTNLGRAEQGSQHEQASRVAEEGGGYVSPLLYPDRYSETEKNLEERQAASAKAAEAATERAERLVGRLEGEQAIVPESRRSAPDPIGAASPDIVPEDYPLSAAPAEHPVPYAIPQLRPINVGAAVSRQDFAHQEIGVVTEVDRTSVSYPLAKVMFPESGEGWFALNNLRYEGEAEDLVSE